MLGGGGEGCYIQRSLKMSLNDRVGELAMKRGVSRILEKSPGVLTIPGSWNRNRKRAFSITPMSSFFSFALHVGTFFELRGGRICLGSSVFFGKNGLRYR